MKFSLITFLLFWVLPLPTFSQVTCSLTGNVIDNTSSAAMVYAAITILNSSDSILVNYTRVKPDGSFMINDLSPGRYIILIGYPGYVDYVQTISIGAFKTVCDLGSLSMVLKAKLLEEVLIKGKISKIVIRGDTTEYNAASFRIEPNSRVEDLLKQLPGIQIDQYGKITAQGKVVNTVLVDGEEFFNDDPTLVTRNIRNDMVDKVQLYDRKSDRARLTGVDDGVKNKTINIKLKEDKKNGYFGKLDAAAGNDNFYQTQAMFNYFKKEMKFSAYGNLGNTGKTGLTSNDNHKYGMNTESADNGAIKIAGLGMEDLDSSNGRYNGEGNPSVRSSGIHFNTKWDDNKQFFNTDFKIGAIDVSGTKQRLLQNNLPTGINNSTINQEFENQTARKKLDAIYGINLNPSMDLKIAVTGASKEIDNDNKYDTYTVADNDLMLNQSKRDLSNNGKQQSFHISSSLTKRFKRKGRYINFDLKQTFNKNNTSGFLNTESRFYSVAGILDSIQNINQYKMNLIKSSLFNSKIEFSEPISTKFFLLLDYSLVLNYSTASRKTFEQDLNREYTTSVPGLSNDYEFNQTSNQLGALLAFVNGKSHINIGTKISRVNFEQIDLINSSNYRNFFYWNPQASYRYNITPQKSLNINISGNTVQPTMDQIQPITINNDPLNIVLGNPGLRPSFSSSFNFNYYSYKTLDDKSIFINGSYIVNSGPIVDQITTDNAGKSIYQFINLSDKVNSSFNVTASWDRAVKKTDLQIGASLGMNTNTYFNVINQALNRTFLANYNGQLKLSGVKQKNEFFFNIGPEYATGQSSLQSEINNNGWALNSNLSYTLKLPGKIQINTNANHSFREKTLSFNQQFNRFILNAKLSKKFWKNESLVCSFSCNDMLNQNIGLSRSASNNMLLQDSYSTIRRYFMLAVIFDFNKLRNVKSIR